MRHLLLLTVCVCFLVSCFIPTISRACIWDCDTLAMERARFPEVNELIAGYFPRHSPVYYEWRREQIDAIPIDQRTAADYDDLAASYDKLGEHQRAIDTMLAKIERFPDEGQYESQANLGTFYIHNGQLEQGLQHIEAAITINPDAHFGREVYQKLLVEYVLEMRKDGRSLPLNPFVSSPWAGREEGTNFAAFVIQRRGIGDDGEAIKAEIKRAVSGVLGMMRFGNYDSPVLLEALGDLLNSQTYAEKVQRLAVRAYLKASYEVDDPAIAEEYRVKAEDAIGNQEGVTLEQIEGALKEEIATADAFFAQLEADEKAWADAGKDLDAEFARQYYASPEFKTSLVTSLADRARSLSVQGKIVLVFLTSVGMLLVAIGITAWRKRAASARGQ